MSGTGNNILDYKKECDRWLKAGAMNDQITDISEEELQDCFCKKLEFGTGGIRAIMGPGTNRLNKYTIIRNTEGYARYVAANGGQSVVIAYDNRNHSQEFAKETAKVLSSHGIQVFLFDGLRPTPELSFAVRYLKAFGGIVITASHNPPEYNGYKIYDKYGCQCVPRDTDEIIRYIRNVEDVLDVKVNADETKIHLVSFEIDEEYYKAVETVQERPELEKRLKIVYTPLHGTGYIPVSTMFRRLGYKHYEVSEQCTPDGNFSNTESPNPEDKNSFIRAVELAKEVDADLIIATDPDCDRIGLMVRHKGKYEYLTGNQTGAILLKYLIETKIEKGTMPEHPIVFNTIVTSDLGTKICEKYGIEVESTLTGFKYIGDKIREYEGEKTFLFGYEESYGYMIKDFTRDKDGVQASVLAAEMCNYYIRQGKTLIDVLDSIYNEFGLCEDIQESETIPGINGQKKMKEMVDQYRYGDVDVIEGRKVIVREDYLNSTRTEIDGRMTKLSLPKSNVIKLFLEDGSWFVVRPSGNEPKIKYYKNLWTKRQ